MSFWKKLFGGGGGEDSISLVARPDLDELLNSDDENGSIIALDNHVSALCGYGDHLEKLSDEQKNFYFNQSLEREVNNGGFNQFFYNSTGDFAHETFESLRLIGAVKTARILQNAINEFPNGTVPKDREQRVVVIKTVEDTANQVWEELDERFFAYEDDLNQLNLEYVRQNLEKFSS